MIRVCEICTVVPASHIALFDVTGSPTHPQPSRSDLEGHDSPVTRPPTQILLYGDMEWGGPQFVPWNLYVHAAAHFRYCTDNQLALHRRVNGAARAIKDVAITRLRWRGGVSGRGSWVARWHAHVLRSRYFGKVGRNYVAPAQHANHKRFSYNEAVALRLSSFPAAWNWPAIGGCQHNSLTIIAAIPFPVLPSFHRMPLPPCHIQRKVFNVAWDFLCKNVAIIKLVLLCFII